MSNGILHLRDDGSNQLLTTTALTKQVPIWNAAAPWKQTRGAAYEWWPGPPARCQ